MPFWLSADGEKSMRKGFREGYEGQGCGEECWGACLSSEQSEQGRVSVGYGAGAQWLGSLWVSLNMRIYSITTSSLDRVRVKYL